MGITIPGLQDLEVIGEGGAAVVYRALQTACGRHVAVKVLRDGVRTSDARRTWRIEARAMAAIPIHPNILPLHSVGITGDNVPYLVMPYMHKGSLAGQRLPSEVVASYGCRLAKALAVSHAAGVLHRDVKPSNLLLSDFDEPLLSDFGIAHLDDATPYIGDVQANATIVFAAPEYLSGQAQFDERCDVYSLGVSLVTLLLGRRLYNYPVRTLTDQLVAMERIRTEPTADLAALGLVGPVARVLDKAIRKEPEQRFATAAELADALTECLEPSTARRSSSRSSLDDVLVGLSPAGDAFSVVRNGEATLYRLDPGRPEAQVTARFSAPVGPVRSATPMPCRDALVTLSETGVCSLVTPTRTRALPYAGVDTVLPLGRHTVLTVSDSSICICDLRSREVVVFGDLGVGERVADARLLHPDGWLLMVATDHSMSILEWGEDGYRIIAYSRTDAVITSVAASATPLHWHVLFTEGNSIRFHANPDPPPAFAARGKWHGAPLGHLAGGCDDGSCVVGVTTPERGWMFDHRWDASTSIGVLTPAPIGDLYATTDVWHLPVSPGAQLHRPRGRGEDVGGWVEPLERFQGWWLERDEQGLQVRCHGTPGAAPTNRWLWGTW